jgi:hypothetical protein
VWVVPCGATLPPWCLRYRTTEPFVCTPSCLLLLLLLLLLPLLLPLLPLLLLLLLPLPLLLLPLLLLLLPLLPLLLLPLPLLHHFAEFVLRRGGQAAMPVARLPQ